MARRDRDEQDEPIEVDCPECGKPGCKCYLGRARAHGYAPPAYPKDGPCTICGNRRDHDIHDVY